MGTQYTIDAKGKKIGRLASEIAGILQGKKSPFYNPRLASGVRVLVKGVSQMDIRRSKMTGKIYHRHTGYMGHLKSKTLGQKLEESPAKVLRLAVARMLPKNFLRPKRLKQLVIEE